MSEVAGLDARFATCVRVRVVPRWPVRLPRAGMDGVARRRSGVLERLLHVDGAPVVVRAAQPAGGEVVLGAWADDRDGAAEAVARMRRALGLDDDLAPFVERFRWDPLIGASVRRRSHLRVSRRPVAFEALAWAICEQLIEFTRAAAIERRIVRRLGRADGPTGLFDLPAAATLARTAPAQLCAFGLAEKRALALIRCAREVATGRVDLDAYATEDEVRELFAPYGAWAGLAATHALALRGAAVQGAAVPSPTPSPGRNSLVNACAPGATEAISFSSAIHVV